MNDETEWSPEERQCLWAIAQALRDWCRHADEPNERIQDAWESLAGHAETWQEREAILYSVLDKIEAASLEK